jgi:hypothetical protein
VKELVVEVCGVGVHVDKNNLKYQGGDTGVIIPFSGLSHCTDPNAANYLWHCNFGTDTEALCAWEGQEYLACTHEDLHDELNCSDHSMHSTAQLEMAYDDGCCMMLDCAVECIE